MSWLLFALLAINLWAVGNIIDKNVISKRVRSPATAVIIGNLSALLYGIIAFVISGEFAIQGFFIGVLWSVILLLYYKALAMDEASRIVALYSMTPIFVSILAFFFLGEAFGAEKYIGIILIVLGAMLISMKKLGKFTLNKIFPVMLLTVII